MPTIFLVEDNATDVELFRLALREACVDCELILFEDGGEIIDYLLEPDGALPRARPDLIMLDLNLPKNSGLEVLQAIRQAPSFADVRVAVLTSSSSPRERAKLAAFNVREFIVKLPDLDAYLNVGWIVRALLEECGVEQGNAVTRVESV
jgi:CheY-like chemotaxis protein